jgi:TonB family protein
VVAIWIDTDGRVRHSKIHKTSGDDKVDADIIAALNAMPPLRDRPPPGFRFPTEVHIRGTRRG